MDNSSNLRSSTPSSDGSSYYIVANTAYGRNIAVQTFNPAQLGYNPPRINWQPYKNK